MKLAKHLPSKDALGRNPSLRFLGGMIFEPNLWHFNRHSVSYAILVGSICCFLPMPFQMIPCLLLCTWIKCNVPLSLTVVWISNPITIAPMMYFAYRMGALMLGMEHSGQPLDLSLEWFSAQFMLVWQPLLLGCLVCGFTLGMTGFTAVRLYWRWRITSYKRKKRQAKR